MAKQALNIVVGEIVPSTDGRPMWCEVFDEGELVQGQRVYLDVPDHSPVEFWFGISKSSGRMYLTQVVRRTVTVQLA